MPNHFPTGSICTPLCRMIGWSFITTPPITATATLVFVKNEWGQHPCNIDITDIGVGSFDEKMFRETIVLFWPKWSICSTVIFLFHWMCFRVCGSTKTKGVQFSQCTDWSWISNIAHCEMFPISGEGFTASQRQLDVLEWRIDRSKVAPWFISVVAHILLDLHVINVAHHLKPSLLV